MNQYQLKIITTQKSNDGTTKFLLGLHDNLAIETVALRFYKKYTLCLSTQVGCKFQCSFCLTGKQTFQRNLSWEEITGQYITVWNYLKTQEQIGYIQPNIVFMGQGEPLDNFEALKDCIHYLTQTNGFKLGPRQITLSTVGIPKGLIRLRELPPINLAFSLHATTEEKRNQLMPVNKRYRFQDIINILIDHPLLKRQFINIEYLLLKDVNDLHEDALALGQLLKKLKCIVNLIPFNPSPELPYTNPDWSKIQQFKEWLVEQNLRTMIRIGRGVDIHAACGQLRYGQKNFMGHGPSCRPEITSR